jgi:hypothetical protein
MQDERMTGSGRQPDRNKTLRRQPNSSNGYNLYARRKTIRAVKVDAAKEKKRRMIWILKWVVILPLSAIVLMWLGVILIDLFKY